jgi:hypothetical protein
MKHFTSHLFILMVAAIFFTSCSKNGAVGPAGLPVQPGQQVLQVRLALRVLLVLMVQMEALFTAEPLPR